MKRLLSVLLVVLLSLSLHASDKTFALVLSGGGAKGIADIEILKELDRRGLYPDYVVGTSIGAVIGAFYAAGYSGEEIEKLIADADLMDMFLHIYSRSGRTLLEGGNETPLSNLLTLDFSSEDVGAANGIIDDQYVAAFLRSNLAKVLEIKNFDDFPILYRAVGTDLESGGEIVYSYGSIYSALRGSMAIPIVFTPAKTDDGSAYVVDGGMVNNLPADIARNLGADIVLAVDLNDVMKQHNDGMIYNNIDTLTGVAFQTLDLVTAPNVVGQYPNADYVIVPELSKIGTLDFGKAEEILAIGRKAVEDNADVFDAIEDALADSERRKPVSYFEIEPFEIKSIVYDGLRRYSDIMEYFIGLKADTQTMAEFEQALMYIKKEEGLKSIGYNVYEDGIIIIKSEEFTNLSSSVSFGLNLEAGIKGSISDSPLLFYFIPKASMFFNIDLPSDYGTLLTGIDINDYAALFASYYYDFDNAFSAFASARIGVGDVSMLSVSDYVDRMDTSDFIFSLEGGAAYEHLNDLRLELSFDFDLFSLGSLKSFDSIDTVINREVYADPKVNFNLKYHTLETSGIYDDGIDIDMDVDIYLRPPFMYDIRLMFESIIPSPIESSKFYISGEVDVLRGNEKIGTSYATNKSGMLTRDYLLLEVGGRVIFSDSFFMDVGVFAEGYETRRYDSRFWPRVEERNLIPFSLLNDWAVGFSLSVGNRSSWGDVLLFLDVTHHGTYSIGVMLR